MKWPDLGVCAQLIMALAAVAAVIMTGIAVRRCEVESQYQIPPRNKPAIIMMVESDRYDTRAVRH